MRAGAFSAALPRPGVTVALGLLIGLLLAACSGGNGAAPASLRSDSGANQELTREQVIAMIPSRRELHLPRWGVMQHEGSLLPSDLTRPRSLALLPLEQERVGRNR
jgi:hypothetical protein